MVEGHSGSGGIWADSYKGMSADNIKGLGLALSSSFFIDASFIVKKKGMKKAGGASGLRAGSRGYSYLFEPLWWVGMITTFLWYAATVMVAVFIVIFQFVPQYGQTNVMVYTGICSLMGSLSLGSMVLMRLFWIQDWDRQNPTQIFTERMVILSGTFMLHKTKDMVDGASTSTRLLKHLEEDDFDPEGIPLRHQDSTQPP